MVRDLDEKAKEIHPKDSHAAFRLREAGLGGFMARQSKHPDNLPDDVEPLTYEELQIVTNLPSGETVPPEIMRKWLTIYPANIRQRFDSGIEVESSLVRRKSTKPKSHRPRSRKSSVGTSLGGMR